MNWGRRANSIDIKLAALYPHQGKTGDIAIVALGSYARRELAAHSDVDVLIMMRDREDTESKNVIRALHSVEPTASVVARTVEECLGMFEKDFRSWLALIESRFVCGRKDVFARLRKGIHAQVQENGTEIISEKILSYALNRHKKYGETHHLLEPNIKNSSGSLRDVHAMYDCAAIEFFSRTGEDRNEPLPPFPDLCAFLPLRETRVKSTVDAWNFFLTVRDTMHTLSGHTHDILEYELQASVAETLGYGRGNRKESVEKFMSEYYRHAKNVGIAFDIIFNSPDDSAAPREEEESISDSFTVSNSLVRMSPTAELRNPDELLHLFLHFSRHPVSFGRSVRQSIDDIVQQDDVVYGASAHVLFDRILAEGKRVGHTLKTMNDALLLGRVIPDFAPLVSYFQHNVYHYYTADEHTIRAIAACEALARAQNVFGNTFRSLTDRSELYWSIFFHDIAKPADIARHEHLGADTAERFLRGIGRQSIAENVGFVVRHHLLMEQTAFRRNYRDRATLLPFVATVGTQHRLDLLLLMTYADLSALNPNVWSSWKSIVLLELYERASRELSGAGDHATEGWEPGGEGGGRQEESAGDMAFRGKDWTVRVVHGRAYSEVTVTGIDRPGLLARLAALFISCDANIIHASIETEDDGSVSDLFRLVDMIGGGRLGPAQTEHLIGVLAEFQEGRIDTEKLFQKHRDKWKRKIRRTINPAVRVGIEYHDHTAETGQEQTIVDVFAPDTFGLLYKLASVLSAHDLNILHAKIATRVDGVVDSFYVINRDGSPFRDPARRAALRSALLGEISSLGAPGAAP